MSVHYRRKYRVLRRYLFRAEEIASSRVAVIARSSSRLHVIDVTARKEQVQTNRQYQYHYDDVPENVIAHRPSSVLG